MVVAVQRLVALDDVDAQVVEEYEHVVDLLSGQLNVLQQVVDVPGVQVALLAALGHEVPHLCDVQLGRFTCLALFYHVTHCLCPTPCRESGGLAPGHSTPQISPR